MPSRSPNAPTTPLQAALLRHITARGLSQRGLAKASDVDHSQISRLLSGKSATADAPTLQRLADALQTTVDELLGRAPPPAPAGAVISGNGTSADPAALLLRLDEIADNPMNPRQTFDEIEDDRLAESIASVGVLQPLLVTAEESPDGRPLWRVDVGGRRLRALRALAARGRWNPEAHNVPARRSGPGDEKHARVVMLVENLQRLDLAPLDEAQAYRELRALDLSTADIAERVHRSQRHVQGRLAIAENLSAELQQRLAAGVLTVDQARALAGAPPHVQAAIERAIAAGGEAPGADAIERRIAGQTIPASRAAFALDDYTAAGGAILDDADSHERLCLDGRLFKRLQRRALLRLRDQLMVDNCAFVDVLSGPPADGAYADTKDEARAGAVLWLGRDLALGQRRGVRRVQPPDDLAARSPANAS